ncbi:deoxyribodipyrimidine photo-lyase [Pseudothauera nasutitermitis]|uniref:Deoxyribodipyrimidine photo-lyase n=1 Tax=Pseudothauera nasutitermitis TaxID=2565930 RepID=A0A4S4AV51_9RHOO|nr:deoxyribodipyrimidine photo-lyase [Pseudothauera nasutitermitis]THF63846.1 deoxyribodipyrimidine photo-lyase [Pseudothauera nasutitermitis]
MSSALVWFRRDLRSFDHAALSRALSAHERVHCVFVFDTRILDTLADRADRRVAFILRCVAELNDALARLGAAAGVTGAGLIVRHGRADEEIPRLAAALGVEAVFANRDYEPDAIVRDGRVAAALARMGTVFGDCKDQVVFERDEVMTQGGTPFSMFTPYRNAWLRRLEAEGLPSWPVEPHAGRLAPLAPGEHLPTLAELGFAPPPAGGPLEQAGMSAGGTLADGFFARIGHYHEARDYPGVKGVSYLSAHLRFGTVSVRELVRRARETGGEGARVWVDELIWREFYQMILWHHPRVLTHCFRPEYDRLRWDDAPDLLAAWKAGRTGYPLVDAGMRQLAGSGYMHNRLRMLTASFLSKDLGVDWRLGERHFADLLLDYDLAANNGGWQWAASTGCDAQPYFRIFNPLAQSERFDPHGTFIRKYVPELAGVPARWIHAPWKMDEAAQRAAGVRIGHDYPAPLVDHAAARARTLARFGAVKG